MKRCFIFAAGSFYGLRERPGDPDDFIVAADGGYRVCLDQRVKPDLLMGDFDSLEPPADFAHVRRLPVEKDDTDTLAAARAGDTPEAMSRAAAAVSVAALLREVEALSQGSGAPAGPVTAMDG